MTGQERATVELDDWREVGRKPIRPDSPAGDPISGDPYFEYLRTELQKLQDVSGGAIAWVEVAAVSREILTSKSKHLLVGSYLCLALFQQTGYRGMLNGLSCLDAMVSLSWEFLYPDATQIRSRIKALEWLNEKLTRAIRQRPPETAEIEAVIHSISEPQALDTPLAQKCHAPRPTLPHLTAL